MSVKLWIGNVPPEASDEDLVELVKRYCIREGKVVLRVDGDGTRPGRVLEFARMTPVELEEIVGRIDGLSWRNRSLLAYPLLYAT